MIARKNIYKLAFLLFFSLCSFSSISQSKKQLELADAAVINHVKDLYAPFTDEQISDKIAQIISQEGITTKVKLIFQSVDDLHNVSTSIVVD